MVLTLDLEPISLFSHGWSFEWQIGLYNTWLIPINMYLGHKPWSSAVVLNLFTSATPFNSIFCLWRTIFFKTTQKQNRYSKIFDNFFGRTITDYINKLITVTKHNILSFLIKICVYLVLGNLIRLGFPAQIRYCIFGDTQENFRDTFACPDTRFEKYWSSG
jgi:hypothetical protein